MGTTPPPAATAASLAPVLRPFAPGDAPAVARVFRSSLLLGRPLPIEIHDRDAYEELCLGWYLRHGEVTVVDVDGTVRGYLLACLDQAAFDRWVRPRALRWAASNLARVAVGRCRRDARRFVEHRIADAVDAWRSAPENVYRAHAHLNVDPELRGTWIGHRLVSVMDALVADARLGGWFGEMNVPQGRSLAAIEAAGAVVVHRQRNRTFSWLLGTPIDRCTVVRPLHRRVEVVPR